MQRCMRHMPCYGHLHKRRHVCLIDLSLTCCLQAYKIGFYGPKIVWVFMGFLSFRFWATELDDIDCTEEQMNEVADGLFLIRYSDYKTVERGIANLTCTVSPF